jgi:hypothetical protein
MPGFNPYAVTLLKELPPPLKSVSKCFLSPTLCEETCGCGLCGLVRPLSGSTILNTVKRVGTQLNSGLKRNPWTYWKIYLVLLIQNYV